jgi:hypothetical protein
VFWETLDYIRLTEAFTCWASPGLVDGKVLCNVATREIDVFGSSTGVNGPLGIDIFHPAEPVRESAPSSVLGFLYVPKYSGDLYVLPTVDFQGTVEVSSHGHPYSETWADLRLTLYCGVSQADWPQVQDEVEMTIVHEHRDHDSYTGYWMSKSYNPYVHTKVVSNKQVYISVGVGLDVTGVSDFAFAKGDFHTGTDRYVRVPAVDVYTYRQ